MTTGGLERIDGVDATPGGDKAIVLVHGTWGRGSRWTRQGSMLVEELKSTYAGIPIFRFEWSGRNQFWARKAATDSLVQSLERLPCKHVSVVAHSHGGNVCWDAAVACGKISKIVALSTPFICVRPNGSWRRHSFQFALSIVLTAICLFALHFYRVLAGTSLSCLFVCLCVLPAGLWLVGALRTEPQFTHNVRTDAPSVTLIAIRLSADEAGLALSIAAAAQRFSAIVVFGILDVVQRLNDGLIELASQATAWEKQREAKELAFSFAGFLFVVAFFGSLARELFLGGRIGAHESVYALMYATAAWAIGGLVVWVALVLWAAFRWGGFMIAAVFGFALQCVLSVLIPPFFLLNGAFLAVSFGWEVAPFLLKVAPTAEVAPLGVEACVRLPLLRAGARGMYHATHSYPDVVSLVVACVKP